MTFQITSGRSPESMTELEDGCASLVLTDPPYGVASFMRSRAHPANRIWFRGNERIEQQEWDQLDADQYGRLMDGFMMESHRILKPGGTLIAFASTRLVGRVAQAGEKAGLYWKMAGVWVKRNSSPLNMEIQPVSAMETWVYMVRPSLDGKYHTGTFNSHGVKITNVIATPLPSGRETELGRHPAHKPVQLMNWFVSLFSNPGDLVVDPFCGSGTVGVAAVSQGRDYWGCDMDAHWADIARRRCRDAAGQPSLFI